MRAKFGGRIGDASLPHEGVDWAPFDIVATDAGYRDAQNAGRLADGLRALTAHGKPAAVTEFGCTTGDVPPPTSIRLSAAETPAASSISMDIRGAAWNQLRAASPWA